MTMITYRIQLTVFSSLYNFKLLSGLSLESWLYVIKMSNLCFDNSMKSNSHEMQQFWCSSSFSMLP